MTTEPRADNHRQQHDPISVSVAKLLLRLTVAGLLLFHGIAKISNGIEAVVDMVESVGLPGVIAYGVYVGEVLAPILVILGWLTRLSAVVIAFNMLVAIFLGHAGELLVLNQFGGWAIELPLLYFVGAVVIVIFGPGRFALGHDRGWLA
jgi:putative oxidoreductase